LAWEFAFNKINRLIGAVMLGNIHLIWQYGLLKPFNLRIWCFNLFVDSAGDDGQRRWRGASAQRRGLPARGSNGRDPVVGWALGTIRPEFDDLARPIKRRINHAAVAALPISFRPALLAGVSQTITNPDTLNAVWDETILRGEEHSNAYARQPG
jgi:hypothetical protein